jgi:predicted RNA-binding protein with PUA-like domain
VIHPRTFEELAKDKDLIRRELRLTLAAKYVRLEDAPEPGEDMTALLPGGACREHDAFDIRLLAAVAGDAATFLITQDAGIHAKAARLGVADRVLTVSDASHMVRTLYETVPVGPEPAQPTTCDDLDPSDPIFNGLRSRYYRYGELLLKAVFEYAELNNYDTLFVEVGPDLQLLVTFPETFGFVLTGERKPNGDRIMVKQRRPSRQDRAAMTPWDLHVRYGPPAVITEGVSSWLVPIEPRYHARLFPEAEAQAVLLPGREAHGNSIRKAYLCRASVRSLQAGDLVYFQKSTEQTVGVVGIVEDVSVLSQAQDIVSTAGKRTVYTAAEIEETADDGREVLVIGFRQVLVARAPVSLADLRAHAAASGPPQTVQGMSQEGAAWLAQRMGL